MAFPLSIMGGGGGMAGGAMMPWLYGLSGAGSLLSLFQKNDPSEQYRKYFENMQALFSPQNINNRTNEFYQQFLRSPAYAQSQSSLARGANTIQGQYARGAAGMGTTTGIGQAAKALSSGAYGSGLSQLQAGGYNSSLEAALKALAAQAGAAGGLPVGQPFGMQQQFGGAMGALNQWLLMQSLYGRR